MLKDIDPKNIAQPSSDAERIANEQACIEAIDKACEGFKPIEIIGALLRFQTDLAIRVQTDAFSCGMTLPGGIEVLARFSVAVQNKGASE